MIVGFAVYNDSEAYYIGIEDALNCANFKDFIIKNSRKWKS